MLGILKTVMEPVYDAICDVDKFHYSPLLGWKGKKKQGTTLGGCSTILIGLIILAILSDQIYVVTLYEGYYHRQIDSVANMKEIGLVQMKDMGTLPYFSVHYKGHRLDRESHHCKETGGDCFNLTMKYLKIKWNNAFETEKDWKSHHYEARIC